MIAPVNLAASNLIWSALIMPSAKLYKYLSDDAQNSVSVKPEVATAFCSSSKSTFFIGSGLAPGFRRFFPARHFLPAAKRPRVL